MTDFGRSAFGLHAPPFADVFCANEPVVVFDQTGAGEALYECVRRRFQNSHFFVRPVLPQESTVRADAVANLVMKSFRRPDERTVAAQQAVDGTLGANGRPLRELQAYPENALRLMQAAVRLSDGVVVSSHAERRRIHQILKVDPTAVSRALHDPAVPKVEGRRTSAPRDAVVIWAPHVAGDVAMPFLTALFDLRAPVLIVSKTPPEGADQVHWVPPERSQEALLRACVIVDTNAVAADSALALAQWKTPLVVDAETGSQERLTNVRCFDRRSLRSIFDAVVAALGLSEPQPMDVADADLRHAEYPLTGPLVSIIIPTFDRPALLRYALESCRRQTYKNLQIIVAIGGGNRFEQIEAEFPEVEFIHLDANVPAASLNAAFSRAAGEYVAVLNDDDVYFPDHISVLVSALERSGAMVAHGDVLTAYLRGADAQWSIYGFESNLSQSVDLTSMLVTNRIGAMSGIVRRACIGSTLYDMAIPLYRDYAFWLRLAQQYDFIHVERITSCYTIRNQGHDQQTRTTSQHAARAFQAIYDAFPIGDRPLIQEQRRQALHAVAQPANISAWAKPAGEITPQPWPPF